MIWRRLFIQTILLFLFLVTVKSVSASVFILTSPKNDLKQKETIAVNLMLDTQSEAVNAFSAYVSYPEDKLQVISLKTSSVFEIEAENTYSAGLIKISKGNIAPVNGRVSIATISFQGLSEGPASLTFVEGSAVPKAEDSSDSLKLQQSKALNLQVVKGYQIKIKIVDKKNRPIKKQKVVLYSQPQEGYTDEKGEVIFEDVAAGPHKVVVKFGWFDKAQEIEVGATASAQYFDLTLNFSPLQEKVYGIKPIYLIILSGLVFGIAFFLLLIHKDKCVAYCQRIVQKVRKS